MPWPQELASGWPKVEDLPLPTQVETPLLVLPPAIFLAIVGNMTGLTRDEDASRFFHLYLAVEARASSRNLLTPSRASY